MATPRLQLAFYKGLSAKFGCLQFKINPPHWYVSKPGLARLKNYDGPFIKDIWLKEHPDLNADDLVTREGCLFLEAAPTVNKNEYDWDHRKVMVALSVTDLGKILTVLEGLQKEIKIMHDPNMKGDGQGKIQKYLTVSSPDGLGRGVLFNLSQREAGKEPNQFMVPLSGDEALVLKACIQRVIPATLGWC